MKTITLRTPLKEPPTQLQRYTRFGLGEFLTKLRNEGWIDEHDCALKAFKISQEGHTENGEYYVEWKATLTQEETV